MNGIHNEDFSSNLSFATIPTFPANIRCQSLSLRKPYIVTRHIEYLSQLKTLGRGVYCKVHANVIWRTAKSRIIHWMVWRITSAKIKSPFLGQHSRIHGGWISSSYSVQTREKERKPLLSSLTSSKDIRFWKWEKLTSHKITSYPSRL